MADFGLAVSSLRLISGGRGAKVPRFFLVLFARGLILWRMRYIMGWKILGVEQK